MTKPPPVPKAILETTKNLRTRESMMVGSHLEGGWYPPFPVGDQGTSFGPYQMHEGGALTSLGLTPSQAEDPVRATKAMLGSYTSAVNQISEQLWSSNPERAAEESAFIAEAPAVDYYSSQGAGAVDSAWTDTQDVLHGRKSSGGMPVQKAQTANFWERALGGILGIAGVGNPTGAIADFFANPVDAFERLGLISFGAIIIIVGLVVLAAGTRAGKAVTAGATRGISSNVAGAIRSDEGSQQRREDQQRRLGIAEKANQLGERKLALKESREQRLTAAASRNRPAKGRHAKPAEPASANWSQAKALPTGEKAK